MIMADSPTPHPYPYPSPLPGLLLKADRSDGSGGNCKLGLDLLTKMLSHPSSLPETVGKVKPFRAQNCYNEAGTEVLGAAE